MQLRKQTAWKKNRNLGDVYGGRTFRKLIDGLFNKQHNLNPPTDTESKPVYIVDNPSRDFFFPVTVEEIRLTLKKLPKAHSKHLTHIWLQKIKKSTYDSGEAVQGSFICGSQVYLIVLHPFPVHLKMRFGKEKPVKRVLNSYEKYYPELQHDDKGWYLQWTENHIKQYYLENLLLHEVGHAIDCFHKRYWSKTTAKQKEDFADNYAVLWSNAMRYEHIAE